MAPADTPYALVLRFPGKLGRGLKAVSQRGPWHSLSDIAIQALRLRLTLPPNVCIPTLGSQSYDVRMGSGDSTVLQIKFVIPRQLADHARVAARERGVTIGCILLEGVALLLAAQDIPWPSRGISRLRAGRPSACQEDLPIVVLDDADNCCAVA